MADKRPKQQTYVTPAGVFSFPKLNTPDTKFKTEGEYSVKLILTEEQAAPLLATIQPLYDEAIANAKTEFKGLPKAQQVKTPFKENPLYNQRFDDEDEPTGELEFQFKMKASGVAKKDGKPWSRKPMIFDAAKKPISVQVWGGTTGKVAFQVLPWYKPATGAGLALRLEAVQIIDLVSQGQRTAQSYGFEEEEGFAAEDAPAADDSAEETTAPDDVDF